MLGTLKSTTPLRHSQASGQGKAGLGEGSRMRYTIYKNRVHKYAAVHKEACSRLKVHGGVSRTSPPTGCTWKTSTVRDGKKYSYDLPTPLRYYMCNGMQSLRLRCRERPYIRAERLEEPIWSEVKRVIQNPDLTVAGNDTFDTQENGSLEEETAQAERDLRSIQMEEDRAIRLFVSGKITEAQLDLQRKFITERLESARVKLDDYRTQEGSGAEKRRLMELVLAWARDVGELTDEERKEIPRAVVEKVVIDRDNNVDITLAIPIDDDSSDPHSPDPESVAIASKAS